MDLTGSTVEQQPEEGPDPGLETPEGSLFRPDDIAVFSSKSRKLRLTRFPANDRPTAFGMVREQGICYEFDGGYFRVTEETHRADQRMFAQIKRRIPPEEYDLLDTRPAEEWLRDHRLFDNPVKGGFVELDRQAHVPGSGPELQLIPQLAAAGDEEALTDLYRREEEGHKRQPVLDAALGALKVLDAHRTPEDGAEDGPEAA